MTLRSSQDVLSLRTLIIKMDVKIFRKVLLWFMDTSQEKPLKLRLIGVRMSGFSERYEDSLETRSKQQVGILFCYCEYLMEPAS